MILNKLEIKNNYERKRKTIIQVHFISSVQQDSTFSFTELHDAIRQKGLAIIDH